MVERFCHVLKGHEYRLVDFGFLSIWFQDIKLKSMGRKALSRASLEGADKVVKSQEIHKLSFENHKPGKQWNVVNWQ